MMQKCEKRLKLHLDCTNAIYLHIVSSTALLTGHLRLLLQPTLHNQQDSSLVQSTGAMQLHYPSCPILATCCTRQDLVLIRPKISAGESITKYFNALLLGQVRSNNYLSHLEATSFWQRALRTELCAAISAGVRESFPKTIRKPS